MPENAGDIQKQNSRRTFYAGAGTVFKLVQKICSENNGTVAEELLLEIQDDANEFVKEVEEGKR